MYHLSNQCKSHLEVIAQAYCYQGNLTPIHNFVFMYLSFVLLVRTFLYSSSKRVHFSRAKTQQI